ncbi:MAG: virulence RhuM family protein [Candidatus Kerfeldbacteria bacterium]
MNKNKSIKNIVIYQAKTGAIEFRGDFNLETIWASQKQIAEVFDVDVRTINEHLKNIYRTGELTDKATIRNFRIVQKEGKRYIERDVNLYNLDAIISVGYRVNSKHATQFRIWATKVLKQHMIDGYIINKSFHLKRCLENWCLKTRLPYSL